MKKMHIIAFVTAVLCAASATSHAESKPAAPNILFFLTDDESWLERSMYGWSKLPTPAFDRVAREGVLFTNGFTSAPSCAPSRASVLTGRQFWELRQGALIKPSKIEFYDLQKDPWQMTNLAEDPRVADEKQRLAVKLRKVGVESGDPRMTGEMDLFRKTRQYVQKRKRLGYKKSGSLPFDEANTK